GPVRADSLTATGEGQDREGRLRRGRCPQNPVGAVPRCPAWRGGGALGRGRRGRDGRGGARGAAAARPRRPAMTPKSTHLTGIGVSPGIASGPVEWLAPPPVVPHDLAPAGGPEAEARAAAEAVAATADDLDARSSS